jgi:metalloendopeptidase OMA1, mitochondrial
MAEESYNQLVQEFQGKILPPNHPITRHVRRVVTRIIESSNLGTLKSDPSFIAPSGVSTDDIWAPDFGRNESVVPGSGGKEWQLMVVNDENMINAMASFG